MIAQRPIDNGGDLAFGQAAHMRVQDRRANRSMELEFFVVERRLVRQIADTLALFAMTDACVI